MVFWIPVLVSKCYFSDLTLNKFKAVWNLQTDKILVKISAGLLNIDIFNTSTSPSPMTCQILWNFTSTWFVFSLWTLFFDRDMSLCESQNTSTLSSICTQSLLTDRWATKLPWLYHPRPYIQLLWLIKLQPFEEMTSNW